MAGPRVKLCGLTRERDRDRAVSAGADAVGVISGVSVETPREVDRARATELVADTPPFVTTVLVTMPETVSAALTHHERVGADAIQLHGSLTPEQVKRLREQITGSVLVAVGAHEDELTAYAASADALLIDSTDEHGGGGTGETHDWERTRAVAEAIETPVVLAGGLTPDNVADAIQTVEPFGVDVASGIEREGGIKDHDAMVAFVENATEVSG